MQMLCHNPLPPAARQRRWLAAAQAAALSLALALGWVSAIAQTTGEAPLSQDNLFKEVGNWMQQTQQLSAGQFDFVPLDSRVKVQPCDRPLVMDLPFATKETVRVRCLGTSSWQLYLRANIKNSVAKPAPPAAPAAAAPAATAVAATPPKIANSAATARRKVVELAAVSACQHQSPASETAPTGSTSRCPGTGSGGGNTAKNCQQCGNFAPQSRRGDPVFARRHRAERGHAGRD